MFMYDVQVELSGAELQLEDQDRMEASKEASAYQELLNTVDAARAGLASGEHDYDYCEDESV